MFIESVDVIWQNARDFHWVLFIIFSYTVWTLIAIYLKEYAVSIIMLSLTAMYALLKLFDLTWLYPSYLWLVFNFIQLLLIMYLMRMVWLLTTRLKELQDKLNNLIR